MNLKKLSYSIYDKTGTVNITSEDNKSIDVVEGLIIPILADIKHNKYVNGTNELLDVPATDIIAENTLTQINEIKDNIPSSEFQHKQITNQIFTSYIPTSNTLTSFNGFNYYSSDKQQQHFNTIKYGIISDIITDDKGNNNLKDIIYETTGSITNIFFNYLSYDLIKKYGILHAEIIANDSESNNSNDNINNNNNNANNANKQWIIANNSYQIFLIYDNVIYDVVSISEFYYHKYSLNLNIMSNISSNPKEVIYSLHYVDNIKDVNNVSVNLENISFFNIKNNKINFITDKTFTNTDNRNLLAIDTNGNIIYQYPDKLGLNSCNIDKSINITLINNQQKINKVFMVNDLLFSIGNYLLSNDNQIIYGNKIKETMTYSVVKLNHNPDLFIPLNDSINNILTVIYRSLSNDNTIHYYSYVVDNKFELIIDNTTYTKELNTITFDKSDYDDQSITNYKLIELNDSITNKVIIKSNNTNILELTPLSTTQSIVTIYDTTYGTIKLFTSNNKAILTVGYITITGDYDNNTITSQTKKYILTEENNNLKVNEAIYPFIKKMIITNKEFNDDTFIISYSIDSNNKGSIRCNRKTTEQIINNNLQDNILQITKDKVRFRVNKESVNKYKFNYANETVN